MNKLRVVVVLVVACVSAVLFAAAFPEAVLAGDALNYRDRMVELFSGKVPYYQFPFEHLPVMIVPMAVAWLLGGSIDPRTYAFALAGVSTLVVIATGLVVRRTEESLGFDGLTVRWVILTIPLLPFLLFRNDSFVVFLALLGILLASLGKTLHSAWVLCLAIFAKGWPGLWAPTEWKRGNKRVAATLLVASAGSLAIVLSPALQAAQDRRGLHTETLGGSLVGLWRSVQGSDLRLELSTAVYIDAPFWLIACNVLVGGLIAFSAIQVSPRPFVWAGRWALMGAMTLALIVASPLFSTQYVAWVAPFAAIDRRATTLMLPVNAIGLILLTAWDGLADGSIWWWSLLVVRNVLFIGLGFYLSRLAGSSGSRAEPSSRSVSR